MNELRRRQLLDAAWWMAPSLLCLILYWPGLLAWFQQDDFVWLNLPNQAHGWHGLISTLFQPTAQGTWRPLSERVFFLVFGLLFGAHALPYRIWVFLTMFANLALLASITTRLTRSRAIGFWAAVLWVSNSKLATVMSWTCEYILVACGFFLLLAFHFFLRYTETGARRYYLYTWAAFLTGFLAMETNVVFPLLAASYALACERRRFRATLPFFGASIAYAWLHLRFAPNQGTAAYTIRIDRGLPDTLWSYWKMAFEPFNLSALTVFPDAAAAALMAISTAVLAGFAIYQARRRNWLPALFLAWFFALLAPVAPLRGHITEYYLTLPVMALAMAAACALVSAWRAGGVFRISGALLVGAFLVLSVPVARLTAAWFRGRGKLQHALVTGVARAHELHPGKVILLDGIDDALFWGAIHHRPFLFLGITDVFLTPGSEKHITPQGDLADVSSFVLSVEDTEWGLDHDDLVVYDASRLPIKNITHHYDVPAGVDSAEQRVDVGDKAAVAHLGPTWYALESGVRWMPRTATVRMPGPRVAAQKLYITALCPAAQIEKGPLQMTVSIDGIRQVPVEFTHVGEATFTFSLPAETIGKANIDIGLDLSRTIRVRGDVRELGVAFGRLEIK